MGGSKIALLGGSWDGPATKDMGTEEICLPQLIGLTQEVMKQ